MTLHVVISTGGTSTSDISDQVRRSVPTGGCTFEFKAEEGSVGGGTFCVDDTVGTFEAAGLRRWWAWEDTETSGNQVIGYGFIGAKKIGRQGGGYEDFVVGAEARYEVDAHDHNQLLSRRLITGAAGERPAETDVQRVQWLLGSQFLTGVNAAYVSTAGAVSMTKADLRGQSAYDVLFDCANRSNKNFHLIPADVSSTTFGGSDTYSLWYDFDYSETYRSTDLKISNVRADVDNSTTFAPHPDAELRRTPERVYSGVLVRGVNVDVYQEDGDTADAFARRDIVHSNPNVSTTAEATTLGRRFLDDSDREEDRITCRIVVPATKVNHVREGQAIEAKFSHFPGYTGYRWMRVLARTVKPQTDDTYELTLVMTTGLGGSPTATRARATRPNGKYAPDPNHCFDTLVGWNFDGENFFGGDNSCYPGGISDPPNGKGLLDYYPQGSKPANGWEGLIVLGTGILTIEAEATCVGVSGGTVQWTGEILVNDTVVGTETWTDSGGGGVIGKVEFTATNVAVKPGDIIKLHTVATGPWTGLFIIPAAGEGCTGRLLAYGDLSE